MPLHENPFGQLLVALVTPFTPDGEVAWTDLERHVDEVVRGGAEGIVVAGTTGESATLTDREKTRLVRVTSEVVADRATVVFGGGASDTSHAIDQYRASAAVGADAIMVAAPAYIRPSQEGILAHVRAIADATDLPVMLYDVPARTGVGFELSTLLRAAEHPAICAVKDAAGDLARAAYLIEASNLLYFAGSDAAALPTLAIDGAGIVSVAANVAPAAYRQLLDAVAAGELRSAAAIHRRIEPLARALNDFAPPAVATKMVLHALGRIDSPRVRLPLVGPDHSAADGIHRELDRVKSLHGVKTAGLRLDLTAATGGALTAAAR